MHGLLITRLRLQRQEAQRRKDAALLETFGGSGLGVFPAALAVQDDLLQRYQVRLVGPCDGVEEHYDAIKAKFAAERDLRLAPGESMDLGGYQFVFEGAKHFEGPNFTSDKATVRVIRNGQETFVSVTKE